MTDCSSVPIPTGGFRYCANVDNAGQKYCFVRPGSQSSLCAGTPATGSAVGNGTYTTPLASAGVGDTWVSYACVAGCTTTDPSVSSAAGQVL